MAAGGRGCRSVELGAPPGGGGGGGGPGPPKPGIGGGGGGGGPGILVSMVQAIASTNICIAPIAVVSM